MKKQKGELESSVMRACLSELKRRGVFCWRQNTGAFRVENRFFRSSIAGVSDIIGVLPGGRFLAVECKREIGGKTSEKQLLFLSSVQNAGGLACIVHSARELAEILDAQENGGNLGGQRK